MNTVPQPERDITLEDLEKRNPGVAQDIEEIEIEIPPPSKGLVKNLMSDFRSAIVATLVTAVIAFGANYLF